MLDAALSYASLGWPVFPCIGKHPCKGSHGFKDATTDPAMVMAHWLRWPEANVAVATGHMSWVLDVDPRHGGDDALAALERQYGPLPDTPRVLTGDPPGVHIHFAPDPRITGKRGSLPAGLDVKGRGGYVLLPPAIHPNGRRYLWEIGYELGSLPLAPAAEWLLSLVLAPGGRTSRLRLVTTHHRHKADGVEFLGNIVIGTRNTTIFRECCWARTLGATTEQLALYAHNLNSRYCTEPLGDDELASIVRSASRYKRDPRGWCGGKP
jgi:putative DNA primase/helicase